MPPRLMLAPLADREIPAAERLTPGALRLIAEPAFGLSEPRAVGEPVPGVRVMLGLVRPVGEGVSLFAESERPGWRAFGTLAPRSIVEPDCERLIEGEPGVADRELSDRFRPVEGLREIEPGVREASLGVRRISLESEGERLGWAVRD